MSTKTIDQLTAVSALGLSDIFLVLQSSIAKQSSIQLLSDLFMEYDSNSNGRYVKFSDGTMICWKNIIYSTAINSAYGNIYRSDPYAASNWPAEFIDTPSYVMLSDHPSYHSWVTVQGTPSETEAPSFMLLRATAIAGALNYNVRFVAIGRWK